MRVSFSLLATALFAVARAELRVVDGQFALLDSVGIAAQQAQFSSASPAPLSAIKLTPVDTMRLSYTIQTVEDEQPATPQQNFLVWQALDPKERGQPGRDHVIPLKIRKGGKAKWELDLSRAPVDILALSTGPISLTLLVGDPKHPRGLSIPLGTFTLAPSLVLPFPQPPLSSLPKSYEIERYSKMPEIAWEFRKPEKRVGLFKAGLGLIAVLSPWVVLFGVIGSVQLKLRTPSFSTLSFLGSLTSLELLTIYYWTSLKLLPTIPYFIALALLTALTGRNALGDMRKARLATDKKAE
ncbi:BZ3500_MvSof-1268-A1-R1_Chr3-1g05896 [Microbotryum saponariae]|uniref:BZ3500_MvSof-1268-A1-R1_Chr3-1g05896 protein n=1 Tax=Microbotryum saponariae TaxID=289078 RepID=A0A2X0N3M8_9BASI|nr:BZ3500_MvSof-1268-A1-R1_Chr3-1g05896 [Microbotryum saponariae]SDA05086.1 BZ3501_MvSof-1269-A2-R1_Chr3-1g05566 [Microbotryum saponariae]